MTNSTVPEHFSVVIVGAGQAGLSLSWFLTRDGIDHVLIERDSVAHEWRSGRWNNFTLVTPNWQCKLPGYHYSGDDPDGFMPRDQVQAFVRDYAISFQAPVREKTEVTALLELPDGGFRISTTGGTITADQVVVATGGYHHPLIPRMAEKIPADIVQLHSSEYRQADQLASGAVLVVGSGQSGAQIAEDLMLEGVQVHLAVGGAPRVARFYRGRDCVAWLDDMGHYSRPVAEHPEGLAQRDKTNHYVTGRDGGRDIDLRDFALRGMRLYGRMTDITDGTVGFAPTLTASLDHADAVSEGIKDAIDAHIAANGITAPTQDRYVPVWQPEVEPTELDLQAAGISTVIWSIGYRGDYRWIQLPIFDGSGYPRHHRGVSSVPGVYFLGLPWLHTWGSGRFAGVAKDAEYLNDVIHELHLRTDDKRRRMTAQGVLV